MAEKNPPPNPLRRGRGLIEKANIFVLREGVFKSVKNLLSYLSESEISQCKLAILSFCKKRNIQKSTSCKFAFFRDTSVCPKP
ncbi:hypothetical protein [Helicobacter macacae]|uniref:hypothetical protein n=1 Tax=Helicobacter macacae TaxID=398626 RepID=UPI00054D972A|nr:hypothetical protein [Helicobacter macacae]